MKRNLLFTTVFCLLSVCAFSQINLGVKAGLNLANLSGDDIEDTKMRPSYLAGVYLGIGLGEKFGIQPEVLLVSNGAKIDAVNGDPKQTYKFNYITVPVMFKYQIIDMLNVQAGPQLGILTSAKVHVDGVSDDVDIKDSLKSSDFGLAVGAGLDFGKLNVTARYCFGFSDIADSNTGGSSTKNQGIQVAVGYSIFSFGD